jgi:hypothetical protein
MELTSNTNTSGEIMNSKMTKIFAGTVGAMLIVTGLSLPASARINSTAAGTMPNTPNPNGVNRDRRQAAHNIIGQLDYGELAGSSQTVEKNKFVRIDRQGQFANGDMNIQIQLNQPHGHTTIATVIVPRQYTNSTNRGTHREVERNVRDALLRSLNSYLAGRPTMFTIQGRASN